MTRNTRSILEQLAQEARIMTQARMLPATGELTPEQIDQVREDFVAFTRENNISMTRVAKALGAGYSQAILSNFVHGKDKGDVQRITRGVNQWMEDEAQARAVRRPEGFVETDVAVRMLTAIRTAKLQGVMALIHGPAGVGKTMVAKVAQATFPGSIYSRITQSTRRGPGFTAELARLLGVSSRNNLSRNQAAVIEVLRDSGRLLIVDEVHQAAEGGLEALRDLHDEAGIPIVMIGTVDAVKQLTDTSQYYGQFASRIAVRCDVTEQALRPRNPKPLYSLDEIMEVFSGGRVRLAKDGGQYLQMIANVPGLGGLRICDRIMRVVYAMTKLHGRAVGAATLEEVFRQMHGEAFAHLVRERVKARADQRAAAVA